VIEQSVDGLWRGDLPARQVRRERSAQVVQGPIANTAHRVEFSFVLAPCRKWRAGFGRKQEFRSDALAENESARQVMGEPTLRVIAHELVMVIKGNVSVDWMHRDSARANIRRHVKRLLRKYDYPPDLHDAAVQNVLQQAEALSADWAA
jgi:hypothetical protein